MDQILDAAKIQEIKSLIQKGVVLEEEFVLLYMKMIRDEGFMEFFPESGRGKAEESLDLLIKESAGHKQVLEKIISELK